MLFLAACLHQHPWWVVFNALCCSELSYDSFWYFLGIITLILCTLDTIHLHSQMIVHPTIFTTLPKKEKGSHQDCLFCKTVFIGNGGGRWDKPKELNTIALAPVLQSDSEFFPLKTESKEEWNIEQSKLWSNPWVKLGEPFHPYLSHSEVYGMFIPQRQNLLATSCKNMRPFFVSIGPSCLSPSPTIFSSTQVHLLFHYHLADLVESLGLYWIQHCSWRSKLMQPQKISSNLGCFYTCLVYSGEGGL